MIKFELNNNEIKTTVNSEKVNAFINKIVDEIRGDVKDKHSFVQNTQLFHTILKDLVLTEFIKQLGNEVEENKPYMFSINLGKETFFYLVTNIQDEKLPSGFTIDRLMLLEYSYNKKFMKDL